jgi:D-xylulose kinase
MADQLFIGIDNGTQGTKCVVFSRKRRTILASAYAPHDLIANDAGRREQEPQEWIDAATRTLKKCLSAPGVDRRLVKGIGVSGQQHGCVPLDKDGRVLRPAKLWCDTETVAQCESITAAVGGPRKVVAAIGNAVAAGFTASKVRWLKEKEPAKFARLAHVLLPHDYLNFWLTGEYRTECGDASGTAYFDVRRRRWSQKLVAAIDNSGRLAAALPEIIPSDAPHGTLRPALAAQFGLPAGVLVASGGGDNMMAAIGTGNVVPGMVTTSLGTSGTIYSYSDAPIIDPQGELAAFCSSSGGWLPLICTMNVTVATELTRGLFGRDLAAFNADVASAPIGAGGIRLLPYFNGERTPPLPRARAALAGLSTTNFTRANVCRAAMEGATLGLRYGLDLLRRQGVRPSEIRLVGGGSKSRVWRQIVAEVFGCPVVCPVSAEAGAMGAVIQSIWCNERAAGARTTLAELTARYVQLDRSTRAAPRAAGVRAYEAVYAEYLALHRALSPLGRPG